MIGAGWTSIAQTAAGPENGAVRQILHSRDPFFHLADLEAYSATRQRAAEDFRRSADWSRRAILTIARMGWFSSDRSIREYAAGTWNLEAVPYSADHA
jgi:glucan phosphorylase